MSLMRTHLLLSVLLLAACSRPAAQEPAAAAPQSSSDQAAQENPPPAASPVMGDPAAVDAKPPPAMPAAERKAYLSSIAKDGDATCSDDASGNVACSVDGHDVEFSVCGDNLSYGGVVSDGVELQDRIGSANAKALATLQKGQFVCIEAIARETTPERYYVKAVPVESVAGCKGNGLCKTYGDRPVQWKESPSGQPCRRVGPESYAGDCPAGWVDAGTLEEFSMGL